MLSDVSNLLHINVISMFIGDGDRRLIATRSTMDLVVRDILVLLSIYPLITINLCEPTKSTVIGAGPSAISQSNTYMEN